jgi:purine nucleoside permease
MNNRFWRSAIVLGLAALTVATGCSSGSRNDSDKIDVGVPVITMFAPEHEVWLQREQLPSTVDVPGAYKPVRCNSDRLCVAETGEGKSNAATTMMAILNSEEFDFSKAYFLTAGIAGSPPDRGTLGAATWADWVVDFDLGNHFDPREAPEVPFAYRPVEDYHTAAYHLDEALVNRAFQLTREAKLADSPEAAAERTLYPGQRGRTPGVMKCGTMTGDDYFSGKVPSDQARYVMEIRTEGKGVYCTTQMEDNAVATALNAHGYLNRYLSLRTVRDFDQPHPGQTVVQHLDQSSFPGFKLALENIYIVGRPVVDDLLKNPPSN